MARKSVLIRDIKQERNEDNVWFGDIFWLTYYGINVIMCVSRTTKKAVTVYELETKQYKNDFEIYDMVTSRFKASKKPLIIKGYNSATYSDFWCETHTERDYKYILVPIEEDSKLYIKALEKGIDNPEIGFRKAYWVGDSQQKNIENLKIPVEEIKIDETVLVS